MSEPDITLRLLESAANDPEADLLLEARDEIERLRANIREQAAELERFIRLIELKNALDKTVEQFGGALQRLA